MSEVVLDLTPGVSQALEIITDLASHRSVDITPLGKGAGARIRCRWRLDRHLFSRV